MKKNSKSPMKKEQKAKRAKAQRPVEREPKQVLAELLEKLSGKLELKATSASQREAGPRGELSPNLDRLRHLSRKLCFQSSCGGLEACLKHGIELMQHGADGTSRASPSAFLEGRDS